MRGWQLKIGDDVVVRTMQPTGLSTNVSTPEQRTVPLLKTTVTVFIVSQMFLCPYQSRD
jgi:hypothetical protein